MQGLKTRIAGPDANSETECAFGKRCLLQCASKDNTHDFLTPRKLSELEGFAKNLCIESSVDWVFAYRPCTCLKLEAWPDFIREASAISGILFGAGSGSAMQNRPHATAGAR